jgi:trimethylamine--corrinoid protein Co-methyltransferase
MVITDEKKVPYQIQGIESDAVQSLHMATLSILEETGVVYEDQEAIALLASAGAIIEKNGRVRIPSTLVEKAIASAPSKGLLYSREGNAAIYLEPGYVYFGTGSDCPYVIDIGSSDRRLVTKHDIEVFTRLSDALPNIDFILSMGIASDVPAQTIDLHHFQAMVCNTTKPVFFTVVNSENMAAIINLANQIAGSPQALKDRPFIAHFAMPSPPLRHSRNALQNLIYCARHSIPVVYASGTQMGSSGPMSIAGCTISSNCDVLSGLVVHQLAYPGAPFIYGVCVPPFDMKTMVECYGAPEHFMGDLVNVQLAQKYGLPTWGYAADTDAKVLDLQAALEYFGSTFFGLLSNCNLLHDVGYLESGLTASCESIVLGNEVIEFGRRILRKVIVNDETMSTEAIKRIGPGGNFFADTYTLRHFRDIWYSPLIDRNRYELWVNKGRLTMFDRIKIQTQEILVKHQPIPLNQDIFKDMSDFIKSQDKQFA